MTIRLFSGLLALMLCACAPEPPTETATEPFPTPAEASKNPVINRASTVAEADQIAYTAEANPEVIDDEQLPTPVESDAAQVSEPAKRPTKSPGPARTQSSPSPASAQPDPAPAATPKTASSNISTGNQVATPNVAAAEPASAPVSTPAPTPAWEDMQPPAKPDHSSFNALLKRHVNAGGNVNYSQLKQDEKKLDEYLSNLSDNPPSDDWSRNERLAYWINAYNAYTLKLIVENYPVKSITDLNGGKPWDRKWIEIGDRTYSLNQIEHDIIRPRFKEPRIHFAVNCAAASCPPLPNKAFTANNLNSLLETRTRAFIRNDAYNTVNTDEVAVSKIFDWYGEDFGDLRAYLNRYADIEIPAGKEIGFREYDWALNEQ